MTREEAIKILNFQRGYFCDLKGCEEQQAFTMAIKALEQEPCTDAISRQAVLMQLDKYLCGVPFEEKGIDKVIKELPPVTPAEQVGHWEWVQYYCDRILGDWVCSECKSVAVEGVMKYNEEAKPTYNYCPQCGCKIQEVKE